MTAAHEVTQLLADWANGDPEALDRLTPLVYGELRQVAAGYLRRERADHTLQPTALVHEAYLRLVDQQNTSWRDRSHFYGIAARLMRQILVEHARHRRAAKRDGGYKVTLNGAERSLQERTVDLMALDDALQDLARLDPRQSWIEELRYFGGLTVEETAEALKISPATVQREWTTAKVWLRHEMRAGRARDGTDRE